MHVYLSNLSNRLCKELHLVCGVELRIELPIRLAYGVGPGLAWSAPMLGVGTVLAHSYRLLEPIGEGGMGCVWVAEHIALDRKVAVKVMTDEAILDPATRQRFEQEARATARVDSPHVVRVLDFDFTEDGLPFLVLELLTGETLEERIVRSGPLSIEETKAVLDQTSEALGAAHSCGILHRDIKAENLFLQRSDAIDVKLLDFGIALMKTPDPRKHITLQRGPIGTPQYMSPEQMMVAEVSEQSDLFSLGVCVYYALTGEFPFCGDTLAMISVACLRGSFQPPSVLCRELPTTVDAWFRQALALEPAKRFASTSSMRESFAVAVARPRISNATPLAIEVKLAKPTLEVVTTRPWRRRALIAGATLVACVALAATRAWQWLPSLREVSAEASHTTSLATGSAPIENREAQRVLEPTVRAKSAQVEPAKSLVTPSAIATRMRATTKRAPPAPLIVETPDALPIASSTADPYGTSAFGSRE
jgi:serine/threonine protein kinase